MSFKSKMSSERPGNYEMYSENKSLNTQIDHSQAQMFDDQREKAMENFKCEKVNLKDDDEVVSNMFKTDGDLSNFFEVAGQEDKNDIQGEQEIDN